MSECECKLQPQQNELLHVASRVNMNVLSDRKSSKYTELPQSSTATWREHFTGLLITSIIHIRYSDSDYAQVEARLKTLYKYKYNGIVFTVGQFYKVIMNAHNH